MIHSIYPNDSKLIYDTVVFNQSMLGSLDDRSGSELIRPLILGYDEIDLPISIAYPGYNKIRKSLSCIISCSAENNTKAYLALCENPYVDVIGHCTTDMFPFDMERCVKKFREYGKLVEINESSINNKKGSRRNSYELLRLCKKYEVPVTVDSDCHFCQYAGQIPSASLILEEIDFPKDLIINLSLIHI